MELVNEIWKPPSPVRALRVTAINLVPEDETFEQVDLFASAASREQQERPESAMASIRTSPVSMAIPSAICCRFVRLKEKVVPLPTDFTGSVS